MNTCPTSHQPNLPDQFVHLDAFNLMVGAAFMLTDQPDPRVWVVEKLVRDSDFEIVSVWSRVATGDDYLPNESAFRFHYMEKIALVGLVVNPSMHDDCNFGA